MSDYSLDLAETWNGGGRVQCDVVGIYASK